LRWESLPPARTPPRHCRGGTAHGCGERADRRGRSRVLPVADIVCVGRISEFEFIGLADRAQPFLVAWTAAGTDLFDGGLRRAQTDQAIAAYDANVAGYRQTVLNGFKEVEDNLVALRILQEEAAVQDEAVQSVRQAVALTTNQYKAGLVSYLNVVVVQATALANERTAVDLLNRRLAASVLLVKALGGGWNAADLPTADQLARGESYPRKTGHGRP
jgi:hypothetical protein